MSWLGIDLGTGSVKLLLAGNSVVSTLEAYPVSAPQPGYAETPVEAWLAAIRRCTARMDVSRVEAISFSGQMHGIVPLSFTKGVLSPAILWADQRGREVFPLLEDLAAGYRQRVRNPWAAGMALTTILWLKRNRPEIYRAADVFLHPKDYIRYALTGTLGTEPSDASGSLMFDMEQGCWMGELLEVLGLEPEKLPPILKSDEIVGTVTPEGAAWSGLPSGTRVAAGAGDTPAAIYGSGLDGENSIQISIGTAMQVVRLGTTVPEFHPALNAFSAVEPGTWYRMAAMLNGGLALEWIRSTLGIDWDDFYSHTDTLSPPWDLQFLPYLTGERTPYLNPDARAVWSGLGLHHKPPICCMRGFSGLPARSVLDWRLSVFPAWIPVGWWGAVHGTHTGISFCLMCWSCLWKF